MTRTKCQGFKTSITFKKVEKQRIFFDTKSKSIYIEQPILRNEIYNIAFSDTLEEV